MKKHISIITAIIVSGLLFSCKNSVELVKRHYGSGYYLAINNAPKQKTVKPAKYEKASNADMEKVLTRVVKENLAKETVKETPVITASAKKEPVIVKNKTSNQYYSNITKTLNSKSAVEVQSGNKTSVNKQNNEYKAPSNPQRGGGATDPVVLVILSIFIPPLAVYLKEDKIGTAFWIDLILCLLFWLPGIIFALLVCFDAVKLN